ncbi:hypothetical protein [Agromyces laixinhei]|uniref:hypothetical protein n=1 Tax=Agromyces laixinhei TaxID=2585717 RepID=UPI001116584F|nr:hypothetical protein [Agromyces laixinhei]
MTAVMEQQVVRTEPRSRFSEVWRVVRLHAVTPSVFFGIPWIIIGFAWLVSMVVGIIAHGAGGAGPEMTEGMRYSWAVLSPQWYLAVVGVQSVGMTLSFALGFGATRRDFWLGTSLMFGIVALLNAIAIATLVQVEKLTNGWGIGISMFDALWYGQSGWIVDFYTTLAMQLLVLFIGASITTVYLRWRMRGMLVLVFSTAALVLAAVAIATFTESWPAIFEWLMSIGIVGGFTLILGIAAFFAIVGYFVIRRATPR